MGIVHPECHSEVSLGVRALHFERYILRPIRGQQYIGIKPTLISRIGCLKESDLCELDDRHTPQGLVGLVDITLAVELSGLQITAIIDR